MTGAASLPTEVIQEIISNVPKKSLRNVSLVCRTFCKIVTPILYKNVDFETRRLYGDNSLKRQLQLLTVIAENPELGASVHYFSNCSHRRWEQRDQEYCDATTVPDVSRELLRKSATNLIKYYEKDVVLKGYLDFFMRVVEKTCPSLESLDIHFESTGEISDKYPESYKDNASSRLTSLRHFGVRNNSPNYYDPFSARYYTPFVEGYVDILESLDIPTPNLKWAQGDFDLLFGLCDKMPQLKSLKLTQFVTPLEGTKFLEGNLEEFHPFIEHISIQNIGCKFFFEIGKLFQSLKFLRYLRIGDENDRTEAEERLADYEETLYKFILELPPSLEELYIEINALNTRCWYDEDFDPVCKYEKIFLTLRRLHTCDIHGWFEPRDSGDSEEIPEKGVFYRGLPRRESVPGILKGARLDTIRDVCTTRMNNIYQSEAHEITEARDILTLDDGKEEGFEGPDAGRFCGGFDFMRPFEYDLEPHYSWPFPEDLLGSYKGFSTMYERFS